MAQEQKPPEGSVIQEAHSNELEQAFAGPAIHANRVFVTISAYGIRLTFMEAATDEKEFFRTAVYMNMPDAESLRDVLTAALSPEQVPIDPTVEGKA